LFLYYCCQARYDGELQVYLKATGLQASDLVKAKVKKSKPLSSGKAVSYATGDSPSQSDPAKPAVDNYADSVNSSDGVAGVYAANGVAAAGSTLPHFSQVWSSSAQDVVYSADQLLAQMTGAHGNGQLPLYHAGANAGSADAAGVLVAVDANQHLQPTVYQYVCSTSGFSLSAVDRLTELSLTKATIILQKCYHHHRLSSLLCHCC